MLRKFPFSKFIGFFLTLIFVEFNAGYAQSSGVDYCENILSQHILEEGDFVKLDSALFNINYYNSDVPIKLYHRARSAALSHDLPKYAAMLEVKMADLFYETRALDSAHWYADHAGVVLKSIGDELAYARTANIRRLIYTTQSDFSKAYQICFEALEIFERLEDKVGTAITNRDIGSIKIQELKYHEALRYCLKGVDDLVKTGNWYELSFSYQRIAIIYRNLGQYDNAHAAILKSMDACRQLNGFRVEQGLAKKYWTRGYIYEHQGLYDQTVIYYDSAKYFAEKIDFYLIDNFIFNYKGGLYLKQKRYKEALEQFNNSLAFMEDQKIVRGTYDFYLPVYSNLVEAYEGLGQFQKANEFLKEITLAKDSIFKLDSEKQVAELQTKYETAQKEATIVELQEDKIMQRNFLILGSILLSSLVFLALLLWRNNRFRKRVNKTLQIQKDEIKVKSDQNELLLKEIHHRVKNNLEIVSGLLTLQSAKVTDPDAQEVMLASNNRVQAMGILHQKLYQGTDLGVVEMKNYFMNLGEGILDSFDLDDRIQIELAMDTLDLDLDTAVPIGLIVNELLTNALKYAFPEETKGKIRIKLEEVDMDHLILEVADNGVGAAFDAPSQGTGFGSQLVDLLTQQLRGSISQRVENGTIISLKLKKSKAA